MDIEYKEEGEDFLNQHIDDFNIIIVTATKIEKKTLHQNLTPLEGHTALVKIAKGNQTYFLGVFGKYNTVHVACGDMGSVGRESSIIVTKDAISFCKPKIVLMVGIAFGIDKKKQLIGDVLVSERVTPYEPQRIGEDSKINRGKAGPANILILNRFRNSDDWRYELDKRPAKVIPCEILSGEKLIDNPDLKRILTEDYPNAKGGEMEGAGIYAACDGEGVGWILVKGICDYADGKKGRKKKEKQQIAVKSAINLSKHVFNSLHAFKNLGVYPIDSSEKKSKNSVIENCKKQVDRQLKKQVNSGKYLPNTFIETGEQKDCLRYLCDSIFFSEKCFNEILALDFRLLNLFLKKNNHPQFELDFEKFIVERESIDISRSSTFFNGCYNHLNSKRKEIADIRIASNLLYDFKRKFRDPLENLEFLKSKVGLVTESAGQGKTNFLCDFVDNFLNKRGIPTLFFTGNEIEASNIRLSILNKVFPNSEFSFEDFLGNIEKYCKKNNRFFVLIIDGINENYKSQLFSENLETLISELIEYDFIRIVISSRTEYYQQNFSNFEESSFSGQMKKITNLLSSHPNDDLVEKLFDSYLDYFEIEFTSISNSAYSQLVSNFLLLRIFCETYKNQNLEYIDNIFKEDLFERYYVTKCKEINKRQSENDEFNIKGNINIKRFVSDIAKYMINEKTYVNVPLDKIIGVGRNIEMYIRFLDENILVKRDIQENELDIFTNDEVVNFTFDEFRDFIISKYLIEDIFKKSETDFVSFVESEITKKSVLTEGCSTFLFFIARRRSNERLSEIISRQDWYKSVFAKSIFSIKDFKVTTDDLSTLRKIIKSNEKGTIAIIYNLIFRYDISRYKNLNIRYLLKILRNLNETDYNKCFSSKFGERKWGFSLRVINQATLIDQFEKILDDSQGIKKDSKYHNIFELFIYMFTNENAWKIKQVYERYLFKNRDIGDKQLKLALTSKNQSLTDEIRKFIDYYDIEL